MSLPDHPMTSDPRAARIARGFEQLTPDTVADLLAGYCPDARFIDPFNDVQGRARIGAILSHMFATLVQPRFEVRAITAEGAHAWLVWDFCFQRQPGGDEWRIHGATQLTFDAQGLVSLHRDYWDAAGELYAKVPVLGRLMRWLASRLRTPEGFKT